MQLDDPQGEVTVTETRQYAGYGARFGTDPDEISIDLRAGSPAYIRLRPGDVLREGDAAHHEQHRPGVTAADSWEVVEITPEAVTGRHVEIGTETTWPRHEIEKKLAVGTFSTDLSDFERVSVYQVGRPEDHDPDADRSRLRYRGRPYVSVVAYGNNGRKYGRRYRFADQASNAVYLWKQDEPAGGFTPEVEGRLDRRVTAALESEGYRVVDREPDCSRPTSTPTTTT